MQAPIGAAAGDANASNASGAPDISVGSTGAGTIYYRGVADEAMPCNPGEIACASKRGDGGDSRVTFVIHGNTWGGTTVRWCDKSTATLPCWDVERVALHEFGHILDLGHHPSPNQDNSIMHPDVPTYGQEGWQIRAFRTCDKARLQLTYDLASPSGGYTACLDHVPGAIPDSGLETSVTFSTNTTVVCVGQYATFSGTLRVATEATYEELSGNPIASRTVKIQRRPIGGSWSDHSTAATGGSGSWSRSVTFPTENDYEWRSRFTGDTGLDADNSAVVRIRWEFC